VIAEVLKHEGIDRIFGIPGGGSTSDLIDAVQKAGMETILTCHEASAALIASVYGEIKERPGVCFSIMGPGATNLASGIAYAYLEQLPLIAITERYGFENYEFFSTQKIDHGTFFAPITKGHFTVISSRSQDIVEKAIYLSKEEKPGPVHIDLPNDEAVAEANYRMRKREDAIRLSQLIPRESKAIRTLAERIESAQFPVMIAGIGAKRGAAEKALTSLAENWRVPVMVGLKGRGVFDEAHPLYAGVFQGTFAKGTFEDSVIGKSDLLVLLGVDSGELLPKPWGLTQPVIHIGFQPNLDAAYPAEMEVVGDIKTILEILVRQGAQQTKWDLAYLKGLREHMRETLSSSKDDLPLHRIIEISREKLPSDGVLATDVGAFNSMVNYLWQVHKPKTYFTSKGLSTMGIALPSAIAAQLALPDSKVICFTGDGGFLMRIQELEVCSRLDLPIIVVVFSDSALGLIKVKQKDRGFEPTGVQLKNPDFPTLIQAFGGQGFRATTEKEFDQALEMALNSHKLSLIEAVLDPQTYGDHMKLIRG
jgi:acetolactate synthase-1/2/3 large subunit